MNDKSTSKVTFLPDENSIKDPKLVADLLERIENCLDKGGSNTFLTGIRDSIKKSKSYTPNQIWRVRSIEEQLDKDDENNTFFGSYEDELHGDQ